LEVVDFAALRAGLQRAEHRSMRLRVPHPLEHHPSFRAAVAAASPLAELAVSAKADVLGALAIACSDLAHGFAAPPGSRERIRAHHRAWVGVREIDRVVAAIARRKAATPEVLARARRAIDRADVMIAALPGVLPT
jgi:hypothetical protein